MKEPAVYIITNKQYGVLYIGVTSDLMQRMYQHRSGNIPGFAAKYNCTKLVYFERTDIMEDAIAREKQLKTLLRMRKIALIELINPSWNDLAEPWFNPSSTMM